MSVAICCSALSVVWGLAGSGFDSRSRCMCDHALHRSSLDVCFSWVSCASTHTDLAPAPTRPSYFEASLTCPKHVRLYLCATSPSHPRGSKSIQGYRQPRQDSIYSGFHESVDEKLRRATPAHDMDGVAWICVPWRSAECDCVIRQQTINATT